MLLVSFPLHKVFIIHTEIIVQQKPVSFAVLSTMFHGIVFDTALVALGLMGQIM